MDKSPISWYPRQATRRASPHGDFWVYRPTYILLLLLLARVVGASMKHTKTLKTRVGIKVKRGKTGTRQLNGANLVISHSFFKCQLISFQLWGGEGITMHRPFIAKDPEGLDSDRWIPLRCGARIPRGQLGDSRNTSSAGFTDLNPAPRGLSH